MAKKNQFDYDLIVIGSGAGGSAAATIAAREGKKVAIVEAETFGGESPNWSDVPMRALAHAAHIYYETRHAGRFGLRTSTIGYNYPSLRAWKDLAVEHTGAANGRKLYAANNIDTYQGRAHFLSPHEISVSRRHISAASFVIATGSHWEVPSIAGIKNVTYLTPRTLLEELRPPKSLYVVGGGSIGVEIAELMAIFGTKVYIAEAAGRILPHEDEEVGELMERYLSERRGIVSLTQTRTSSVVKDGLGVRVTYTRGDVEKTVRVDHIVIATSRLASVDLGLENASVDYTPAGIQVNDFLQTTAHHIYAAGDVLGRTNSTQTALLESRVAIHNILHKKPIAPDYTATPRVTYTSPAVASVGLNEDDCLRRDLKVDTALAPLSIVAQANISDFRDGFVKLVADKKGVLIGGTIVAPGAAEMIGELALAIKYQMTASQLAATPHAFPTWSEAIRVAAGKLS